MFKMFKKIVGILAFACVYCIIRTTNDLSIGETVFWWIGVFSYCIYLNLEDD